MYRFLLRPKWIAFHLLIAGLVVLMLSLGFWQLRRMSERKDFNAEVRAAAAADVVPLDDVVPPGEPLTDDDADEIEWRRVEATGQYLDDEEFTVVNRSQSGRAGFMVVTPLQLDDGRILLVERGFVPLDDQDDIAAAPDGDVTILGRLRTTATRARGQLSDKADGDLTEVQRIDIGRLAAQLPGDPVPMYLELIGPDDATARGYPAPVEFPELTDGPHLSYAVQWFIFSLCGIGGWVLALRHSIATRRRRATAAGIR